MSGLTAPQPAETCSAPAGCVSSPLHRKRAAPALHTSHRLLRVPPTDCSPCRNHTRGMSPRGAARALERNGKGYSPANGTSASIAELMSGRRATCCHLLHPKNGFRNTCVPPFEWRFSGVGAEALLVRPHGGFVGASRAAALRGCGCRSQASRQATVERRRDRHGPPPVASSPRLPMSRSPAM